MDFLIGPDVHPVIAPQLDRVLGALGTVSAAHIISRTEVLASPADALRMLRMERYLGHGEIVILGRGLGCDFWHRKTGVSG